MMRAIYQKDADGNWVLVAAFCIGLLPEPPADWPQEITDWLESEGQSIRIVETELTKLPEALRGVKG